MYKFFDLPSVPIEGRGLGDPDFLGRGKLLFWFVDDGGVDFGTDGFQRSTFRVCFLFQSFVCFSASLVKRASDSFSLFFCYAFEYHKDIIKRENRVRLVQVRLDN